MRVSIAARPFLQGLLVAGLAYIVLILFLAWHGNATLINLESRLASATAPIQHIAPPPEPVAQQTVVPTVDLDQPAAVTPETVETPVEPASVPTLAEQLAKAAPAVAAPEAPASLPPAPIDGLYEKTADGMLPQVAPDTKLTPFAAYRRPFKVSGTPVIALVVDDYGLSQAASQKALDALPPDVSLMMSSYAGEPQTWLDNARKAGHEVWMKLNFETTSYPHSDPGPQALLANASLKYNQDRLQWTMTRGVGYAGIAGGTDYIFESASSILQPLVKFIYKRGVAYFETNTNASEMIETMAVNAQAPYAKSDLVVNDGTDSTLSDALAKLERTASERGYAVGIVKPYATSFAEIKNWAAALNKKGITLAPVSAVASLQLNGPDETEETIVAPAAPAAPPVAQPEAH